MIAKVCQQLSSLALVSCAIASVFLLVPAAYAGEAGHHAETMSVERLKVIYLGCEDSATSQRLAGGDAMYCSIVYEELKERAFDGNSKKIREWLDSRSGTRGAYG